ncbi:hypothetical protein ACFV6B_12740 [Streptomyces microflavus]|uniref:hypothetical protein n=1 Tax=Streptomyces microflavus TaxID=1919 RepID=UPI00365518DC
MSTDIGQMIADLQRRMQKVEAQSRLKSASLDDAALLVRDGGGSLRAVVGQQGDGTTAVNVVNGPPPPVPSAPVVAAALAALTVTWDGSFEAGAVVPLDWMRCEVHVGATAGFTPSQGTLRDTIETPQGGMVTIPLPYTEWHVKLRSRTSSGAVSAATSAVAETPRKAETTDLTAGIITADLIAVDALTGKTITGGVITGATIQTDSSGARIVLDANQLYVLDASSNVLAEIEPADVYGRSRFITYNTVSGTDFYSALNAADLTFGIVGETDPDEEGRVSFTDLGGAPGFPYELSLSSGNKTGVTPALISMYSGTGVGSGDQEIVLNAAHTWITGRMTVTNTTFTAYTPTVAGGGSATFTSRTGWYYKLGKMVYFNAEFVVASPGSGSSAVTITAPSSIYRGARQSFPAHGQSTTTSGAVMNGHAVAIESGSGAVIDRISLSNDGASNRDNILNGTNLLATARVSISGWYREA